MTVRNLAVIIPIHAIRHVQVLPYVAGESLWIVCNDTSLLDPTLSTTKIVMGDRAAAEARIAQSSGVSHRFTIEM